MLPSLPILAGQGFIIRAAQKSMPLGGKGQKSLCPYHLNGRLAPRWTPYNVHPLFIIRVGKATSWPLGSSSTPGPLHALQAFFVSRPGWLFLTANSRLRENKSSRVFLNYSEELWWENMTKQFPSRKQFFGLLSLTFVIFPHFSALHGFLSL